MPEHTDKFPESTGNAAHENAPREEDLTGKMRTGATFWGLGNIAARGVKAGVWLLLLWVLDDTDMGLVAMTAAFMMVLQMLSEFGVGVAVIQKKDMPASYASTAFWLNFGASAVMFCGAWALAPWLATFYGEARVTLLVRVSALGFLVVALRTIPMALLRKRLQFGRYAALDTAWHISSGALTAVMALLGAGYWSMVLPPIIAGLALAPLWFFATRWRPSFAFEFAVFREVFLYSKNVVSASLLLLVLNNAGFIIAGHLMTTGQAGEYKVAMENGMFVVFNFAWLVGNVALSGFALRQGQDERLRAAFTRVYEVLTAATLPFHVLLFVLADVLFSGVIDPKWAPAMPLFRILLIYATVRAMIAHVAPFYNAINRTDVVVKYYGCVTVLCLPAMYFGCLYHGLTGLAWASSVLQALGAIVILGLTPRILHWPSLGYVKRTAPFVLASVAVALAAKGTAVLLLRFELHAAIVFFAASAVGGLCYPVVLYLVDRPRLQQIVVDLIPDRIRTKYFSFLMRPKENAA